jgi:hypothetical protein
MPKHWQLYLHLILQAIAALLLLTIIYLNFHILLTLAERS